MNLKRKILNNGEKKTRKYPCDLLALFRFPLLLGLRRPLLIVAVVSRPFVGSETQVITVSIPGSMCRRSAEQFQCHAPLLLAGLLLSILALLRLAATDAAALPPLLLFQWQVLIRIIVDKLVHVASFLTLGGKEKKARKSFTPCSVESRVRHEFDSEF